MKDKEIKKLIKEEKKRQDNTIELIASENFVSKDVLKVAGSILTNKYAEGYPNNRYYGGCLVVDKVEDLAKERANIIFNAKGYHVNVQPHSGSQANMAVYRAILKKGDVVLAMDLNSGGHLTHGSKVSFSGKDYKFVSYGLDKKTETINYDKVEELALEHKPKLIVVGASAYPRIIDFKRFKEIADKVNAYLMCDMAHIAGLIVASLHPTPFGYADFITSTTHKTLRGPRGGLIFCKEEFADLIDKAIFPGIQGGPLMHIIGAKAVCFKEAMSKEFVDYQKNVLKNIKAMEKVFKENKVRLVSEGSDNHMLLLNVKETFGVTGKEAQIMLEEIGITCNKNMIINDKEAANITSGIRVGTAAMTSKGYKEKEFTEIAYIIIKCLSKKESVKNLKKAVKKIVFKNKIKQIFKR